MNTKDARELLSSLWCLYPNASSLSKELARRMAFEWAAFLATFSLSDVRRAMYEAVKDSPRYIPNAPEIYARCSRSLGSDCGDAAYAACVTMDDYTAFAERRRAAEAAYIQSERDRWEPELRAVLEDAA